MYLYSELARVNPVCEKNYRKLEKKKLTAIDYVC